MQVYRPKLMEKKLKTYKKRASQWRKAHPSDPLPNDDRDDATFEYQNLAYPAHVLPDEIALTLSEQELADLPHPEKNPLYRNKYTTAVDPRNFLTTLEYKVNGQSIIWDYNTGYVHLTAIWKALGNNKADILNLLDNAPELEPYLRRVRGGFLKIQGSWLDFDHCYKLAAKICWKIRYALVPVFGVRFLDDVLTPSDFGYGELKLNLYLPGDPNDKTSENKKRRKRMRLEDLKKAKKAKKFAQPTDDYAQMMSASASLRQLKFGKPVLPTIPKLPSLRSCSLPNESALISDDEGARSDPEHLVRPVPVLASSGLPSFSSFSPTYRPEYRPEYRPDYRYEFDGVYRKLTPLPPGPFGSLLKAAEMSRAPIPVSLPTPPASSDFPKEKKESKMDIKRLIW